MLLHSNELRILVLNYNCQPNLEMHKTFFKCILLPVFILYASVILKLVTLHYNYLPVKKHQTTLLCLNIFCWTVTVVQLDIYIIGEKFIRVNVSSVKKIQDSANRTKFATYWKHSTNFEIAILFVNQPLETS